MGLAAAGAAWPQWTSRAPTRAFPSPPSPPAIRRGPRRTLGPREPPGQPCGSRTCWCTPCGHAARASGPRRPCWCCGPSRPPAASPACASPSLSCQIRSSCRPWCEPPGAACGPWGTWSAP